MLIRYSDQEQLSQLNVVPNTGDVGLFSNIESSAKRGLRELEACVDQMPPAVIVGGGPSLNSTLESIRHMKACGATIFALNNAARFLYENGITADLQIILDAREANAEFLDRRWAGEVLLCSQCHPALFDRAAEIGLPVRIWHPVMEGIEKYIPHENPLLVGGGITVGLSGMCVVYTLGHRELHLFGCDSCHSEKLHHAYEQILNDQDELTEVAVEGRVFRCSVAMAAQAQHFQPVAEMLANLDCEITVHGDGLIPHIANRMTVECKPLTAIYDLAVSPPTYDFIGFLSEAEVARIEGGYTCIDIVFQPGPIGGFRHDNLPPSVEERESMLHRICVPACRLLPTVRNVTVLKQRKAFTEDVFPKHWTEEAPISQYGTKYLHRTTRPLRSTAKAMSLVRQSFQERYVTITLREAEYWPERNSRLDQWTKVADYARSQGLRVVWVGDTSRSASIWSWDIDYRMALYEGAVVNLAVSGGPSILMYCSDVPYLMFKILAPNSPTSSAAFLSAHGFDEGSQFSPNGKAIWSDDDAETVIGELKAFLHPETTQLLEEIKCHSHPT